MLQNNNRRGIMSYTNKQEDNMKKTITKKVKEELKKIIDQEGYWSEQVKDYIAGFDYPARTKLHSMAQVYNKYQYGL